MQTDQAYGSDGFGRDEADPQGLPERSVGPFASSNLPLFTDAIEGSGTPIRRFLFAYGDLPVIGELRPGPDGFELRLLVVVGRLPYSVESRDQREKMLNLIRAFPPDLGQSLVIAADQSICLSATAPLPASLTPAAFLSSLVARLFHLDPVLRSLAEILPDLAPALGVPPAAETEDPGTAPSR